MKQAFLILFTLLIGQNAFGVCLSPISRTNVTTGQILTSTKFNLDLNTVYAKVNNLPGDCINDDSISTAKLQDASVTEDKIAAAVLAKFVPAGVIVAFGGTVAPSGYLLCNGQAVSRTTYADLYAAIGTAYGSGNGSTTFNVPDLRGRFLRGVDGGTGRDTGAATRTAMSSGGNVGDNVGSVQDSANKDHEHFAANSGSSSSATVSSTTYMTIKSAAGLGNFDYYLGNTSSEADVGLTSDQGEGDARPVNANVNYIIKI